MTPLKGATKPEIIWSSKPDKNGTQGYWETILDGVDNMSNSGKYDKLYISKGIGNETLGAKPNNRPDIMGVRKDGKIDQIEVLSKTDSMKNY